MTQSQPEAPHQSDVDPLAVVLAHLKAHPTIATLLGGPEHVSGIHEAPWPHLIVTEGIASDLRRGDWEAEYEIALQLLGHPTGAPGKAEVRRLSAKVMRVLLAMEDEMEPGPTDPVVSKTGPSGGYIWHPTAGGQPTYRFAVRVTVHPPTELPAEAPAP